MLGKGYIFQIYFYFPFFAEASISYAFVFIALFHMLKLLDQMLLLQSVIYVESDWFCSPCQVRGSILLGPHASALVKEHVDC